MEKMEKNRKIWKDMERYGKIWKDMERYGKIWKDIKLYLIGCKNLAYSNFMFFIISNNF
jgi:hypothetical protein